MKLEKVNFQYSDQISVVNRPQFEAHVRLYEGYIKKINEIDSKLNNNPNREEAAIAHILNAEGEKIQKFVANCNFKKEDLLEVNASVESMVESIIVLENLLKAKLELVVPLLDKCKGPKPRKEHDDCKGPKPFID